MQKQTWAVSADKQYVNCIKNDIITAVRLDRLGKFDHTNFMTLL